jgi:hypothetical protein
MTSIFVSFIKIKEHVYRKRLTTPMNETRYENFYVENGKVVPILN